jgi:hypothetical protein
MTSDDPISIGTFIGDVVFSAGAAPAIATAATYAGIGATAYGYYQVGKSAFSSLKGGQKTPSYQQKPASGVSQQAVQSSEDMERKRLVAAMGRKATFISGGSLGEPAIGKKTLLSGNA